MLTKTVVAVGDTHFPFNDKESTDKVLAIVKGMKPDMIIQMGDLYDLYSYSRYPRGPNFIGAEEETKRGQTEAEFFWYSVRKASPKSKRFQLTGNHDERIVKDSLYKAPEHEHIAKSYLNGLMSFNGVETIHDAKEELFYDGVCYQHGFRKFGEHALFNQMNTVCGHLHRGALQWNQNINGSFFELNVGWLGDKKSPVFSYRSQNKISKTTVGVGIIDFLGPRFVCFE